MIVPWMQYGVMAGVPLSRRAAAQEKAPRPPGAESTLEWRIRNMTAPRARRPLLRAAGFACVAAVLAACETSAPMGPAPAATLRAPSSSSLATARTLLERHYPQVLREGVLEGDVIIFEVDADGRVVSRSYHSPRRGTMTGSIAPGSYAEVASLDMIESRPGELGPTAVSMAVVHVRRTPEERPLSRDSLESLIAREGETMERFQRDRTAAVARHYPPLLRDAGISAHMFVRVVVGRDGRARDAVVTWGDPRFAEAALSAVRDIRFAPTAGVMQMTIQFNPPGSAAERP